MGGVHDAIEEGVRDCRISDVVVPVFDRQLARDDRRALLAPDPHLVRRVGARARLPTPPRMETVLHELVREHLETFLEHARDTYGAPVPPYVEGEFREYLRCGVFAHGFVRARCVVRSRAAYRPLL